MASLAKPKKYEWKDSNLDLFGSDTDRAVNKESAQEEPAWEGVGQEVGLKIWRIVKFKVEAWPVEEYGEFFSGDSYIILNTYKPDPDNEELAYDVHFWVGKDSTQDEYGSAAYKTVELDTYLDDVAIQHREVQNRESDLFQSYFKKIIIMDGDAETGFRHVTPEGYPTRLLHFTSRLLPSINQSITSRHGGRRAVSVTQIGLNRGLLKSGDVYILDQGLNIIQWNGSGASEDEKFKAREVLQMLINDRKGLAQNETVEEAGLYDSHPFYEALTGEMEDDDDDDMSDIKELYKVSDASGHLDFSKVKEGNVSLADFHNGQSSDVYILDCGKAAYVWIGVMASPAEKRNALGYAHTHLKGTNHPLAPITVVKEWGRKNAEFEAALAA